VVVKLVDLGVLMRRNTKALNSYLMSIREQLDEAVTLLDSGIAATDDHEKIRELILELRKINSKIKLYIDYIETFNYVAGPTNNEKYMKEMNRR
jgi:hypothetical protein